MYTTALLQQQSCGVHQVAFNWGPKVRPSTHAISCFTFIPLHGRGPCLSGCLLEGWAATTCGWASWWRGIALPEDWVDWVVVQNWQQAELASCSCASHVSDTQYEKLALLCRPCQWQSHLAYTSLAVCRATQQVHEQTPAL